MVIWLFKLSLSCCKLFGLLGVSKWTHVLVASRHAENFTPRVWLEGDKQLYLNIPIAVQAQVHVVIIKKIVSPYFRVTDFEVERRLRHMSNLFHFITVTFIWLLCCVWKVSLNRSAGINGREVDLSWRFLIP